MNKIDVLQIASIMYNRYKDKYNSPGWTEWAIIGAFSSIIWLTLGLLENGNFNFVTTVQTFIIGSLVYLALSPVYLNMDTENHLEKSRYFLKPVIKNKYVQFILYTRALMMGVIVSTMYHMSIYENISHKIICNTLIVLELFFIFYQIRRNKNGVVITVKEKNMIRVISIIKYSNILFAATFILIFFQTNIQLGSYPSIKLGLALLAVCYLIEKLIFTKSDNQIFKQIDNVRGQLMFDTMSPKDAITWLQIIEYGLTYEDYINKDIEEYYSKLTHIESTLIKSVSLIDSIGNTEDEQTINILDIVSNNVDDMDKRLAEVEFIANRIIDTTKNLKMFNSAVIEYQSTSSLLKEPLKTIGLKIKDLSIKLVQLKDIRTL